MPSSTTETRRDVTFDTATFRGGRTTAFTARTRLRAVRLASKTVTARTTVSVRTASPAATTSSRTASLTTTARTTDPVGRLRRRRRSPGLGLARRSRDDRELGVRQRWLSPRDGPARLGPSADVRWRHQRLRPGADSSDRASPGRRSCRRRQASRRPPRRRLRASSSRRDGSGADEDTTDDSSLPNLLVVDGDPSDASRYEFEVGGDVEKSNADGASIDEEDVVDGSSVYGSVADWKDAFRFSGDLERLTVDGPATVRVNDEVVDPDAFGENLPHVLEVDGRGAPTSYEITVDGRIELESADPEETATTVSGSTVQSSVTDATHRFRFCSHRRDVHGRGGRPVRRRRGDRSERVRRPRTPPARDRLRRNAR